MKKKKVSVELDLGGDETPKSTPPPKEKKGRKSMAEYVSAPPPTTAFELLIPNSGVYALLAYTLFRYYYKRHVRIRYGQGFSEAALLKKTGDILREAVKRCGASNVLGAMQECIDTMTTEAMTKGGTPAFEEIGVLSAVRHWRKEQKRLRCVGKKDRRDKRQDRGEVELEC